MASPVHALSTVGAPADEADYLALYMVLGIVFILLAIRTAILYRNRSLPPRNAGLAVHTEGRARSISASSTSLERSNGCLQAKSDNHNEFDFRFRLAFDCAPVGMGLVDAAGNLIDANPVLKKMLVPDFDVGPELRFSDFIDTADRDRFKARFDRLVDSSARSFDEELSCIDANGQTLHLIVHVSAVRGDDHRLSHATLYIQDITEFSRLAVNLKRQASTDELTSLLNRRAFETILNQAWEAAATTGELSYLMFMDLDQFKVVNDTSGHKAGDELLKKVAETLRSCVRSRDFVARLGGDEFGIILWECPTAAAKDIAESIRSRIERLRFQWNRELYRIGISIGGLPIDPEAGDVNELQQLADAACYTAKEAGRNRFHMVAGDSDSARTHRNQVRWVHRLRDAMDNNRFAIYAQPILPLSIAVNEPERLEVLIRLRDPDTRQMIPPGAFLPAVDRYGLSVELDRWVVQSLLHMLFVHQAVHAEERRFWVNLSSSSISDQRFADFLKDAIRRSPLPPGTINFEITERTVIRSLADAGRLMADLRDMGCQFALDDFGSGLSSVRYLKQLPIDMLKIDGTFTRDLAQSDTDRIFVKSIIDIAHTLDIRTTAAAIENDETLEIVKQLGADYGQGDAVGVPFMFAPRFPKHSESDNDVEIIHDMAS